jgi:hypothetical protein
VVRREEVMPTPEGIISTSEGPVDPNEPKKEEPKKDSE